MRTLRAFTRWASREYGCGDALAGVPAPRVPRRAVRLLEDPELDALLEAAPPNLAYAAVLLLETGLRASEACGVELPEVRADGILVRHAKGGSERIVPVSPPLRRATARYLARVRPALARPGVEALLVGGRGEAHTPEGLRRGLARAASRAGLEARVHPHLFRHQFAHAWTQSSGPLNALRDALGHTSLSMVLTVYGAPTPADLAAAATRHTPLSARGRGPRLEGGVRSARA